MEGIKQQPAASIHVRVAIMAPASAPLVELAVVRLLGLKHKHVF